MPALERQGGAAGIINKKKVPRRDTVRGEPESQMCPGAAITSRERSQESPEAAAAPLARGAISREGEGSYV